MLKRLLALIDCCCLSLSLKISIEQPTKSPILLYIGRTNYIR